jgi:perosamine synthetase
LDVAFFKTHRLLDRLAPYASSVRRSAIPFRRRLVAGPLVLEDFAFRTINIWFLEEGGKLMNHLVLNGGKKLVEKEHVKWPQVTQRDREAVMRVLDRGVFWGTYAPEVRALEKEWAEYTGSAYALTCNSGTAALHMAVAAADIGPGDEVITSSLTFVASATCAMYSNAIPVFVDVDPRTFNIDVNKLEKKISKKTKAIIPIDLHGLPADYDEINAIAKKHNLIVIADACQSHGATYKGKKTGTLAEMSCFSMNGLKNLTGGDGGLFTTDNKLFHQKADQLRVFGEIVVEGQPRNYNSQDIGWMYRLLEMPAAFVRSRLVSLDDENTVRMQNAEYLTKHLHKIPGLVPPYIPEDRTSAYHHYRIRFDPKALGLNISPRLFRAKMQKVLDAEGVQAQRWQTRPVQTQTLFTKRMGYGKGCPWSCPYGEGNNVIYSPDDYVETQKIIDDSIIFHDAIYPPNGIELMEQYVAVFEKVWNNMDELMDVNIEENESYLID